MQTFQKLHLSNRLYIDTGYLSFLDASIICERLFRDCTEELSQLEIPFEQTLHDLWMVSFSSGARFLLIFSTYTVLLCSL